MPRIKILSIIITTLKILIPVIIVSILIYRLKKVKTSKNKTLIKKRKNALIIGLIISIIIFFLPTIILTFLDLTDPLRYSETIKEDNIDFKVCSDCLSNPFKCD